MEVTVGDPQATQKKHLQEPVEQNGDLAEEEGAIEVRRNQNVIERQQRDSKYGRCLEQVVEIRDRRETPLVTMQTGDEVDDCRIDQEEGKEQRQPAQPLIQGGILEAHEECDDNRRCGLQQILQHDQHLARSKLWRLYHFDSRYRNWRVGLAAALASSKTRTISTRGTISVNDVRVLEKAPNVDDGFSLEICLGIYGVRRAKDQDIAALNDLIERDDMGVSRHERIGGENLSCTHL